MQSKVRAVVRAKLSALGETITFEVRSHPSGIDEEMGFDFADRPRDPWNRSASRPADRRRRSRRSWRPTSGADGRKDLFHSTVLNS